MPVWYHAILIPDESRAAWRSVATQHPTEPIFELLWTDVAHGLRKCLWTEQEPLFWRAWAWTFCRAVETRILGLGTPDLSKADLNQLATAARWVDLLATNKREANIKTRPEMKTFLQEGVRLYTGALNAVDMFKAQIEGLLKSAVEARRSWDPIQHPSHSKLTWGGPPGQPWVYMTIQDTSTPPHETHVECGLWWNAPGIPDPMVYACLWRGTRRVEFPWKDVPDGIHALTCGNRHHLHLPIPDSAEIDKPLNHLLDTILKQARTATK